MKMKYCYVALFICLLAQSRADLSTRAVVTFSTVILRKTAVVAPPNISVIKSYGRRLVVEVPPNSTTADLLGLRLYFNADGIESDHFISSNALEVSGADQPAADAAAQQGQWPLLENEPYSIHVQSIWDLTQGTHLGVVAVLDSGLPFVSLPLFQNITSGYDFISDPTYSLDGDGRDANWEDPGDMAAECPINSWHGLQVSSVLSASFNTKFHGVCVGCSLVVGRVLGRCETGYASDVADAIVWVSGGQIDGMSSITTAANVISMSFAGRGPCPSYLQSAVTQAANRGVILIASAGNAAGDSSMYFPGNCNGVVAVAASTRSGKIAMYSNVGANIALSAPGGDAENPILTLSTDQSASEILMVNGVGTSFSAPHVAGSIALALSMRMDVHAESVYAMTIPYAPAEQSICEISHACGGGILDARQLLSAPPAAAMMPVDYSATAANDSAVYAQVGAACPSGTFGISGISPCQECPPNTLSGNTFYSAGVVSCIACNLLGYGNTLSSPLGSSTCCPQGSYAPTGMTICTSCAMGSFCNNGGMQACPSGLNSPGGSAACQTSYPLWGTASAMSNTTSGIGVYNINNAMTLAPSTTFFVNGILPATCLAYMAIAYDGSFYVESITATSLTSYSSFQITYSDNNGVPGSSSLAYLQLLYDVPNNIGFAGIAISPTNLVLLCDFTNNRVRMLTPPSNRVLYSNDYTWTEVNTGPTGGIAVLSAPTAIAVHPTLPYAVVSTHNTGAVIVRLSTISPYNTSTIVASYAGMSVNITGISFLMDGTAFAVTDTGSGKMFLFNYPAGTLNYSIALTGTGPFYSGALWGLTQLLYSDYGAGVVRCLSLWNRTFTTLSPNIFSSAGYAPQGLAVWRCTLLGYGVDSLQQNCVQCAAGFYGMGNGVCSPCLAGSYSAAGASACATCGAGSFSNTTLSTACTQCASGYSSGSGSTVCSVCSAGYSGVGASQCVSKQCSAGQYLTGPTASTCITCPQGTFTPLSGIMPTCINCGLSDYSQTQPGKIPFIFVIFGWFN